MKAEEILRGLNGLVAAAELEGLCALAAALTAAAAHATARCLEMQARRSEASREDRLLTAKQVAARAGVSTSWVYENAGGLPFTRRLGRALRFSEAGLRRWIEVGKRETRGA